jgi:hypothetical protein
VTSPIDAVAKVTVEAALNIALVLSVQAVVKGPELEVLQFAAVQAAGLSFVFQ